MKVIIVTQARLGSSRLPNKVLRQIGSDSMLSLHLRRLKKCKLAQHVLVATTFEEGVEGILDVCKNLDINHFQGSLHDVLDRFYRAVQPYNPDLVVRVTSDCPLIDPQLVDEIIDKAIEVDVDYCTNILTEDFPDGQDVEVMKLGALKQAWENAKLKSEREHVTPFIRKHSNLQGGQLFTAHDVKSHENLNCLRMTVDEEVDLESMNEMIKDMGENRSWLEYSSYMIENSSKLKNGGIMRNEGYIKSVKEDLNG